MPRSYFGFGLDDFGGDDDNYLGAEDPGQQLAQVFGFGADALSGVDVLAGRGWNFNVNSKGSLEALMADALAADMMFGADDPRAQVTKARVAQALRGRRPSPQMMMLQREAMARQAGKMPFTSTGEQNTMVKAEMLPIPRTSVGAGTQTTIAVRPIRSQQINAIRFPSNRVSTSVCRLEEISILGQSQLNGPGGIACAGLTEVRTAPILKGSTAQAGQDILVTISNPSAVAQVIEGWFEGPDLVRAT